VKTRKITGITVLVLWAFAIVPKILFVFRCKLAWQLDKWALILALILTSVYAIMLTIHLAKGKHWAIKLFEWLGCTIVVLACVSWFFLVFLNDRYGFPRYNNLPERKVWGNKEYVVYCGYQSCFANPYALYKRHGVVDEFVCMFGYHHWVQNNTDYTMYESLDLMKEEFDRRLICDSICHETMFYRLSDGYTYRQSQNDSLWGLINSFQ
jgi:hypothetical protein